MGRPEAASTAKGRARREELLEAALTAFAARGYRGTSLESIADEVGISQAGLLHHFPSKVALLLETLEIFQSRSRALALRASQGARSFADQLVVMAGQHEQDPRFIRLLLVLATESTDPEHPAHEWFAQRYDEVRVNFERQFAADQGAKLLRDDVDPAQLAALAVAVMDGLELQFLLSDGELEIAAPFREFFAPVYR